MSKDNISKYVTLKLNEQYYGLPINSVLSIEKPGKGTRIPNAPDYVIGAINLRGDVVPVIDLRIRLSMDKSSIDNDTRIIIVKENEIVVGLMVDSSKEVLEINDENIDKPPISEDDLTAKYISGIGKIDNRLVVILNIEKLLETRSN